MHSGWGEVGTEADSLLPLALSPVALLVGWVGGTAIDAWMAFVKMSLARAREDKEPLPSSYTPCHHRTSTGTAGVLSVDTNDNGTPGLADGAG